MAWLVLIAAALPWQTVAVTESGAVSTGSQADAAKFVVTGLAVALAFLVRVPHLKYSWPIWAFLGYCLITTVGGLAGTDPSSSLLRSVRFAVVVLALVWVTGRLSRHQLARTFVLFSMIISFSALAARGIGVSPASHVYGGRLAGYLPPLHPNLLGMLAAGGLLCAGALLARRELTLTIFAWVTPILGLTLVLTQSRTSMIALLVSLLAFAGPRLTTRGPLIVGLIASIFVVGAFIQTDTQSQPLTSLLTHNGSTSTTGTLSSRVSEWEAVLQLNNTPLTQAIGQGLASKSVEVSLTSARYAPVDGSWPAAYLSAGFLGVLVLAAAVWAALRTAIRKRDDFALAITVFLIVSSLVADVFNDVTIGLVLLLSCGMNNFMPSPQVALQRMIDHGPSLTRRSPNT